MQAGFRIVVLTGEAVIDDDRVAVIIWIFIGGSGSKGVAVPAPYDGLILFCRQPRGCEMIAVDGDY